MTRLAGQLATLARDGWGLMITPSRRTGRRNEEILRRALAGLPAEIWDGAGENPYFGILALADHVRSEEHTSELQSLMRISYAVFCLKKKKTKHNTIDRLHTLV